MKVLGTSSAGLTSKAVVETMAVVSAVVRYERVLSSTESFNFCRIS